jgi:hypothetical protein
VNGLLVPLLSIPLCAALFVAFGLMRRRAARRTESCSICTSACALKESPHGHA